MNKRLNGAKVLVVDDEEILVEILAEVLISEGAIVSTAAGGFEALKIALANPPDAVISDVRMTQGDGPTLVKELYLKLSPLPKLFFCTAYSDFSPEQLNDLQVVTSFAKPFEIEDIITTIASALSGESNQT